MSVPNPVTWQLGAIEGLTGQVVRSGQTSEIVTLARPAIRFFGPTGELLFEQSL